MAEWTEMEINLMFSFVEPTVIMAAAGSTQALHNT